MNLTMGREMTTPLIPRTTGEAILALAVHFFSHTGAFLVLPPQFFLYKLADGVAVYFLTGRFVGSALLPLTQQAGSHLVIVTHDFSCGEPFYAQGLCVSFPH